MTFPALEDLEDEFLNRACMDVLGDSIEFKLAGGSFVAMKAYGEFAEALRDISSGSVISQDITLQILAEDLPRRPIGSDRVRVTRLGATIYSPVNVRRAQDGKHWEFEVVKVNA